MVQQEDNAREDDQTLDDGLSIASSTFSMSGRSFSNLSIGVDSVHLTPQRPRSKNISQPKTELQQKLPDIVGDDILLEEENKEKDGIIFDKDYLFSRKEQLTKQLEREEARSKSVRNRLLHPVECKDDINGELLGFGSACQPFLDDSYVNHKNGDTHSTSDDDNNTDADSDDHPDDPITAVDKTVQQRRHSTPANLQSMRTIKRMYSKNFILGETKEETNDKYVEETVAFW